MTGFLGGNNGMVLQTQKEQALMMTSPNLAVSLCSSFYTKYDWNMQTTRTYTTTYRHVPSFSSSCPFYAFVNSGELPANGFHLCFPWSLKPALESFSIICIYWLPRARFPLLHVWHCHHHATQRPCCSRYEHEEHDPDQCCLTDMLFL